MRKQERAELHRLMNRGTGTMIGTAQIRPNNRKKRRGRMRYVPVLSERAMKIIKGSEGTLRSLINSYGKPLHGVYKYIPSR